MLVTALLTGLLGLTQQAPPPPMPPITREEIEHPATQDARRLTPRKKHSLQFDDGTSCTIELAHQNPQKVIVDDDGIEIRDEPQAAHTDQPAAKRPADVAPVDSCQP